MRWYEHDMGAIDMDVIWSMEKPYVATREYVQVAVQILSDTKQTMITFYGTGAEERASHFYHSVMGHIPSHGEARKVIEAESKPKPASTTQPLSPGAII